MPSPTTEPLLFGEHHSEVHTSLRTFSDKIASVFPGLNGYDTLPSQTGFLSKSARLALPGLELVASSLTPTVVDRSDNARTTLLIPLRGRCSVDLDGRHLLWGEAQGCLFLPAGCGPTLGYGDDRHLLMLQLDLNLLEVAARAMREQERGQAVDLQTGHARVLPMATAGAPLQSVVRQIGALIDLYGLDPRRLHHLGLQEFIYRQLVLLFRPDWLDAGSHLKAPKGHKRRAIDQVCDAMLEDLSRRITVTDLARQARMSVRSLQYAFQSRFGMSPLDWLREQRLTLARQRLQKGELASISLLAQECGLGTASRFAAFYKQRYGEVPSATAAKR